MLKITGDHPAFQLKNHIQTLAKSFLQQHGFNYFQYLRCYQDGSFGLLSNEPGLIEYFNQVHHNSPLIFSSYTTEHENLHSYWFLWEEELPAYPVQFAAEKFNIHQGLTLVIRAKNYYDMIAVGLPQRIPNITSFYLNKLKGIESFANVFNKNNHELISLMDKNAIALPSVHRDINYQKICLTRGHIEIQLKPGKKIHITAQELYCLRLLLQGASYKQIGQMLHLSPRTVETYIARIKLRTGISSRAGLQVLLSACP